MVEPVVLQELLKQRIQERGHELETVSELIELLFEEEPIFYMKNHVLWEYEGTDYKINQNHLDEALGIERLNHSISLAKNNKSMNNKNLQLAIEKINSFLIDDGENSADESEEEETSGILSSSYGYITSFLSNDQPECDDEAMYELESKFEEIKINDSPIPIPLPGLFEWDYHSDNRNSRYRTKYADMDEAENIYNNNNNNNNNKNNNNNNNNKRKNTNNIKKRNNSLNTKKNINEWTKIKPKNLTLEYKLLEEHGRKFSIRLTDRQFIHCEVTFFFSTASKSISLPKLIELFYDGKELPCLSNFEFKPAFFNAKKTETMKKNIVKMGGNPKVFAGDFRWKRIFTDILTSIVLEMETIIQREGLGLKTFYQTIRKPKEFTGLGQYKEWAAAHILRASKFAETKPKKKNPARLYYSSKNGLWMLFGKFLYVEIIDIKKNGNRFFMKFTVSDYTRNVQYFENGEFILKEGEIAKLKSSFPNLDKEFRHPEAPKKELKPDSILYYTFCKVIQKAETEILSDPVNFLFTNICFRERIKFEKPGKPIRVEDIIENKTANFLIHCLIDNMRNSFQKTREIPVPPNLWSFADEESPIAPPKNNKKL